jgi:hypothetical protein
MWKVFVGEYPGADIADLPGLSIRSNTSSFPFWHVVFLTEQMADVDALPHRIHEASEYIRMKSEAGLLWVCEDYLEEPARKSLPSIITKETFEPALTATGMAGDIPPRICRSHPAWRIERVADTDQLIAYVDTGIIEPDGTRSNNQRSYKKTDARPAWSRKRHAVRVGERRQNIARLRECTMNYKTRFMFRWRRFDNAASPPASRSSRTQVD